jgi:hypothetical protein
VQCGIVCAGWGEREQRKVAFLERRRLSQQTSYWCGGRNVSVCGECSTATMCMPAWAIGVRSRSRPVQTLVPNTPEQATSSCRIAYLWSGEYRSVTSGVGGLQGWGCAGPNSGLTRV